MNHFGHQALHCLAVLLGLDRGNTQLSLKETDLMSRLAVGCNRVAEIGVFEGVTTAVMVRSMRTGGTLYAVDPFFSGRLGVAYGLLIARSEVRRAGRADVECRFMRYLSHEAASLVDDDFDLVFIDADHSYPAVLQD